MAQVKYKKLLTLSICKHKRKSKLHQQINAQKTTNRTCTTETNLVSGDNIPKVAGTNFFKIKKSQNLIGAPRGM